MKIFVARLNYDTRAEDIRFAFEEFGEVSSVNIIMDNITRRSKGFGFVEMPDDDAGRAAVAFLNDTELDGRTIVVKEALDRDNPRRGGGNRGRGGYGGGGRRD